jgi:PadR family transcriptional regulator, regulatory protein PadR
MPAQSKDRLHGTLDALVLKTLTFGPRHGYAIVRWLREQTHDALSVEEGSVYPALYRMERDGWIESDWGTSELGRKAKFYQITDKGRRQLRAETKEFATFVQAVAPLLLPA